MKHLIRNLIAKLKNEQTKPADAVIIEPPDLNFIDLKNNFSQRSYNYDFYKNKLSPQNNRLLNWIGSIDYSGYIREECLKRLIDNYQPGDENRILLRLEDWVPKIQKIAQHWVQTNFQNLTLKEINENYRLILYLSRKEKLKDDKTFKYINSCLLKKLSHINSKGFYSLHQNFRRYLYLLSLPEDQKLRQWIIGDKDPFNRIQIFKFYNYNELSKEELGILKRDKSTFVRRNFINYQIQNNIKFSKKELLKFCFDGNNSIRELARFYLNKYYDLDAYPIYKKCQDDEFYYIADFSKKDDFEHFTHGLNSSNKKIRYLCLKAICKIDYSYLNNLDLENLLVENRKIRKLILLYLPKLLPIEKLLELKKNLVFTCKDGVLVFLNLIYRKSFWHFIDESLSIVIEDKSDKYSKFVLNKYNQKPYIYEKIPEKLHHDISRKIEALECCEKHYVLQLTKQIKFALKKYLRCEAMYLRIIGNEFGTKFHKELSAITDHARLRPSDVSYDEASRSVTFPLVRFPFLEAGIFRNYKYDRHKPIKSVAVVRNVIECTINDNTLEKMDEINLLFGLTVKGDQVVVSSVEEDRGTTCYLVVIKVTEIDLEIKDGRKG